jgi:nicotinate-nucleotide--dimethylbenzimidazole phosphoribosyltransferase
MKTYTRADFFLDLSQPAVPDENRIRQVSETWALQGRTGLLTTLHARLTGWIDRDSWNVKDRAFFLFVSDSGLMDEGGLSSTGDRSTAREVLSLSRGNHPVNILARLTDSRLVTVNMGSRGLDSLGQVIQLPVMEGGSLNPVEEDAMTEEAMMTAIRAGMELASQAADQGLTLLAADGMSESGRLIATAVLSVFFDRAPEDLMERDPDLPDQLFDRRAYVLSSAIARRAPNPYNTLDVLRQLGNLELASMTGFFAGAALYGLPVLLGGRVSLTAALTLVRLIPESRPLFFATHQAGDPGSELALRELGLTPVIDDRAPFSGRASALSLLPLLDLTCALYHELEDGLEKDSF